MLSSENSLLLDMMVEKQTSATTGILTSYHHHVCSRALDIGTTPPPTSRGEAPTRGRLAGQERVRMRLQHELTSRKQTRPPLPPPHVLSSLVPDSPAFTDLMKMEQRLDWTLIRKKAEINDSLGRPLKVNCAWLDRLAHIRSNVPYASSSQTPPMINPGNGNSTARLTSPTSIQERVSPDGFFA